MVNSRIKDWSYRFLAPRALFREKHQALRQLLQHDAQAHREMTALQEMLQGREPADLAAIRSLFTSFSAEVRGMVDALNLLQPGKYTALAGYHKKFDFYVRFLLAPPRFDAAPPFIIPFDECDPAEKRVGNKAKNIALLAASGLDVRVAPGFAVAGTAFYALMASDGVREKIDQRLAEIDISSQHSLASAAADLREIVMNIPPLPALQEALERAAASFPDGTLFAVRSSALGEDGRQSFAGQYSSLLHIRPEGLYRAWLEVVASKYSPEALFYRIRHGLDDSECAMAVLVQQMIDARCSGVLYTGEQQNTLHCVAGLGEKLVGGEVVPQQLIFAEGKEVACRKEPCETRLLSKEQALEISVIGEAITGFFGTAQDIEWAVDGHDRLYILQARELHGGHSDPTSFAEIARQQQLEFLGEGEGASGGVACGTAFLLETPGDTELRQHVPSGAVLLCPTAPPELASLLPNLSALICQRGSRTSHLATVAREFHLPMVTGVNQFSALATGDAVTVDGDNGRLYRGIADGLPPQHSGLENARFREVAGFITSLELVNPQADNFRPEGCRSMHDIIRFCHEQGLLTAFRTGAPASGRQALRLLSSLPLDVYLFDVGEGIAASHREGGKVPLTAIQSAPFLSLWRGLSHEGVDWSQKPFDWEALHRIELTGGVAPKEDSIAFASYAAISPEYLHFHLRFGFHFAIVDTLCSEDVATNYCLLRFAGGGTGYEQLALRVDFLAAVLARLDFQPERKGDYLEARIHGVTQNILAERLEMLGRLLGASKLMDMLLHDEKMVAKCVEEFFAGRYFFVEKG